MLSIIYTIIMFVLLMIGLTKKWHPASWMILVSVVCGTIWMFISGTSMQAQPFGNFIVDCFELIEDTAVTQFTNVIFIIGICMGFVAWLDQIKAPAKFTSLISNPLIKLNKPYLMCGCTFLISALVKFAIPAPGSVLALLLATVYPVLRSVGVSPMAAAVAISCGTAVPWGPSNSFLYVGFDAMGLDRAAIATWSVATQLRYLVPMLIFGAIVIGVSSKILDKNDKTVYKEESNQSLDVGDVPVIYALLPLLPIILLLIITFIFKINIGLIATIFISIIISSIIRVIYTKETLPQLLASLKVVYTEAGNFLGGPGLIIIGGALFAGIIGKVGGLDTIIGLATAANFPPVLLVLVCVVIMMVMVAMTGQTMAMMTVFGPIFVSVSGVIGVAPEVMVVLMLVASALSGPMALIYTNNIVFSERSGCSITDLCKRSMLATAPMILLVYLLVVVLKF